MLISKTSNLVLSSLYSYDFSKCSYSILESIGWDLGNINKEDKNLRNIQIGLMQKDPTLSRFILSQTNRLVDNYLTINSIGEEDIIIRARDGFISKKILKNTKQTMEIDLRGIISKMIITPERDKYLAIYNNGCVEIKGIKDKTMDLTFYNLLKNLNFSTKKGLLLGLENIRKVILSSDNILWFSRLDEKGMLNVPIIGEGILKINKSSVSLIDPDEVDKSFIWDEYLWPFARSILIHCHSK